MNHTALLAIAGSNKSLIGMDEVAELVSRSYEPITLFSPDMSLITRPEIRLGLREYHERARSLSDFGPSEKYVLLHLHVNATLAAILDTYAALEQELHSVGRGDSLVLLTNDLAIAAHEPGLLSAGFAFVPNWQEPGSVYRRLVEAGKLQGCTYEMNQETGVWKYQQIPS